jgi:hypothetical protein
MAKKDENHPIETRNGTTAAPTQEPTVIEETIALGTELVGGVSQRVIGALSALSAERVKLTTRVLDLVEATGQSTLRLLRDASEGEAALERQALAAAERLSQSTLRWGGGSAMAVATAASLRVPFSPAREESAPRAQA